MKLQGLQEVSMKNSEWFLIWCICGREYFIKSLSRKRCFTIHPIRIFLSGSGGTEKSHLIKTIYQPGCFKTITLSCQRSIETLCSSVASNRHIQASRISRHLMDRAMKQSTHQFHKVCFHISKCLACNAEKFLQLKITKKE